MDENQIEAAEAAITLQTTKAVDAIRAKARQLTVAGNGICYACPDPTEPTLYQGQMIYPRFCCPECRDDYDNGVRNPDNIPVNSI